ncbi:MAG: hypothetical protein R3C26_21100 [Calditrichia bacterium]
MNSAPYLELKAGGLTPKDVETGFLGGMSIGRNIDDRFLGTGSRDAQNQLPERNRYCRMVGSFEPDFPITKFRLNWISAQPSPVLLAIYYENRRFHNVLFLRGLSGIGWSFIWNKENNFVDDVKRTRFFERFHLAGICRVGCSGFSKLGLVCRFVLPECQTAQSDNRVEENLPFFRKSILPDSAFALALIF